MRLWHYMLLPYLPKGQLLSQKRECDLIWKDIAKDKKTNHILINYIWEYEDYEFELFQYYMKLEREFIQRGFKFKRSEHMKDCTWVLVYHRTFEKHHTERYLWQCFYNLQ